MNLKQNLIDFFQHISTNKTLNRLLHYTSDPLNPSKAEVSTLTNYKDIKKQIFVRAPKTDDITTTPICRICMYMGKRKRQNRKVAQQDIVFDIYVNIDTYEVNDARSLWIMDHLNELLEDEHITGVGKVQSDELYIIGNPPKGYIGYKLIFTFGSGY